MGRKTSNTVSGTYIRLQDGRLIKVQVTKIKAENINPPLATRQGRYVELELEGGKRIPQFEPVFNASLPQFREDAVFKVMDKFGVKMTPELLKYLGYAPYCRRCGKDFGPADPAMSLEDGTTVCGACYKEAVASDWLKGLPPDKLVDLEPPQVPDDIVNLFETDAIALLERMKETPGTQVDVPVAMKIYKGKAIKRFHGLIVANAQALQQIPLRTYNRVMTDGYGNIVPDTDWKDWLVKSVDASGREELAEFPYLEKTHFFDVVEGAGGTMHPMQYWEQFQTLERGGLYEISAVDDVGRIMLGDLAQKCSRGDYTFPDGTKGEAMIVNSGYHATSGTKQEYISLLAPFFYTTKEGQEKFVWVLKTCQARIEFSQGMDVPKEGEKPLTVAPQKVILTQTFEQMLQGLTK